MWELIYAGGWLMAPIVLCSVLALIIIFERGFRLRREQVAPIGLAEVLVKKVDQGQLGEQELRQIQHASPLGDVLATGVLNAGAGLDYMTLQMQSRASTQIHRLEKNLNLLGTIGNISPLLGLLGTVLGIIQSFLAVNAGGMTDPAMMAGGISQALITTAAGMVVAVPALVAYRYYQRKVLDLAVEMEEQASRLTHGLLGPGTAPHINPTSALHLDDMPESLTQQRADF
ncbi:MAG: MotA/TolQ/ExbB proton channel family protein [Pseudomonadota bacterium]|nr:MotA/TolQ/ExbB proton channel family protein [Pseudomonadota bacterium]